MNFSFVHKMLNMFAVVVENHLSIDLIAVEVVESVE
jgi:hypothetical protein